MVTFIPLRLLALAIPMSRARSPRFFPSSFDSGTLSSAPTRRPKLESNFPHHIPQKLLRGGAGSSATHSSCTKERRNIFIFSLLLSSSLSLPSSLFPMPPEVKQFRNILPLAFPAPLSEHARLLCRPAYSTLVEDVITRIPLPLPFSRSFPCFRPSSSLHRCCALFSTQEISWGKRPPSKLANYS